MFESQFLGLSDFSLEGSIWSLNWSMYENHCLLKYMLELYFSFFLRFYCAIISFVIRFFVLTCLRMAFVQTETGSTHLKVTV